MSTPASSILVAALAGVNQQRFSMEQTLTATVGLTDPGLPGSADLYVGILAPDANTIVFFTSSDGVAIGSLANFASFQPVASGVGLATLFSVTFPAFFSHQWMGVEPHGGYVFFLFAAKAGARADGLVTNSRSSDSPRHRSPFRRWMRQCACRR